jgi:hypothetical protein
MNLNEPTMLTMDLQQKYGLKVSRDSDAVESILQDKPFLSESTGGLLIINDANRLNGDEAGLLVSDELDELDEDCDATETILKRTQISEG